MELSSEQRTEALKNYQAENDMERLGIKLLLALTISEDEFKKIHGEANLTEVQKNELAKVFKKIRHTIGSEEA